MLKLIKNNLIRIFKSLFLSKVGRKILYITTVLIGLFFFVKITMKINVFSEYFYARGLSRFLSCILQRISGIIPFSIFEIFIFAVIISVVSLLVYLLVAQSRISEKSTYNFLYKFLIVVTAVIICYNVTSTSMFKRDSVAVGLNLSVDEPEQIDVINATEFYLNGLIELNQIIERNEIGDSIKKYTFEQYNELLKQEYSKLDNKYFNRYSITLKQIKASKPMTYTYITGVYVGVIGEGSINTNVPNYTLPVTMAHEMAHAKGVMRENEANFTAYYVCITGEDVYIKYSGYMNAFAICYNKIENKEEKQKIYERIPQEILTEYDNHNKHFEKYEGITEKITDFFNSTNLKSAGVKEGTVSYTLTDKYLVALYKTLDK